METMEDIKMNPVPFRAVAPGEILKEELLELGVKQKDFAAKIGMLPSHFNELIKGKRAVTTEIAMAIESALPSLPAKYWTDLQYDYEYDKAVNERRSAEEYAAKESLDGIDKVISVRTLLKEAGSKALTCVEKLRDVVKIAGTDDLTQIATMAGGCFRKSQKVGRDERMISTWVLLARHHAHSLCANGAFQCERIPEITERLRCIFHENRDTIKRVTETLATYGVKFGIVGKLSKASVDGYSFFDGETPCVIMTKRYNEIDKFAFSVMHELGHIAKGHTCAGASQLDGESKNNDEADADEFASDALIPSSVWQTFRKTNPNAFSWQRQCVEWAGEHGLNKWISLGRGAHELNVYNIASDPTRQVL